MSENKMDIKSIDLIEKLGFKKISESFFTADIGEADRENILNSMKPNHFTPDGYRSLFFAHMYPDTEKEFWYATSDVRGTYRGYRCRTEDNSCDAGNIFANAKNCIECAEKFKENYLSLEYNRRE